LDTLEIVEFLEAYKIVDHLQPYLIDLTIKKEEWIKDGSEIINDCCQIQNAEISFYSFQNQFS